MLANDQSFTFELFEILADRYLGDFKIVAPGPALLPNRLPGEAQGSCLVGTLAA
jgi:hypothetical protein